jgi:hypothetical protein
VIADGVSSCNKEEVPIALARLRHEGAVVTTSESFLYECVGDAGTPEYVPDLLTRCRMQPNDPSHTHKRDG